MTKRACFKLMLTIIKWIFWFSLIYGIIIFFTVNSSKQFSQEEPKKQKVPMPKYPSPGEVQAEDLHLKENEEKENVLKETKKLHRVPQKSFVEKPAKSLPKLCPDLSFPSQIVMSGAWQPVDKAKSMYTFSAYYVADSKMVYVVGVKPRNEVTVICQLWKRTSHDEPELVIETEVILREENDDKGHRFISTVFACPAKMSMAPSYVSLVTKECDSPNNAHKIRIATKMLHYQRSLTVCVPPLKHHYNKPKEFVKWVEINKLYGVDKFVVYNYSTGAGLNRVLSHYSEQGLTDIIQWRPPMVKEDSQLGDNSVEIAKYGEIAALNDCLLRSKRYSEFISNVGINEFLIPHSKDDVKLSEMLKAVDSGADAYHIGMSFIRKNKTGRVIHSPNVDRTRPPLDKNQILMNYEKAMPMSKLVIRTSGVDFTLANHVPGMKTIPVSKDKLIMHRHRGGSRQRLGSEIDDALPKKVVNKANTNAESVYSKVPNAGEE